MNSADVEGLSIILQATGEYIVHDVSFSITRGEVLGLVGESGSGKTSAGLTLLGYLRRGAKISAGHVMVSGTDMCHVSSKILRQMRGATVAYIPQDPAMALSPRLTIGAQLYEMIAAHCLSADEGRIRIMLMMEGLDLPMDPAFFKKFPHQLSGGQQQRICICMAFLLRPNVIILDEPTTGLDVLTQRSVLDVIRHLCHAHQVAALYITHDLAVIASIADRVMVMKNGKIVEGGTTAEIFKNPRHPYTRNLIACTPDIDRRHDFDTKRQNIAITGKFEEKADVAVKPVLSLEDVEAHYGQLQILSPVSLELAAGECLALVGQSGSGKTTLAKTVIGLHALSSGVVRLDGQILAPSARQRNAVQRQKLQYVFQSPFTALNPRRNIADSLIAPLLNFATGVNRVRQEKQAQKYRVAELLDLVCLPLRVASLYPSDLSGGERQRVAIARAMATNPKVLLCDEITSALDVSLQATIIQLLMSLQERQRLTMLFVTHNLALVRSFANRIAVMQHGRLIEVGVTEEILQNPRSVYTRQLLKATPRISDISPAA